MEQRGPMSREECVTNKAIDRFQRWGFDFWFFHDIPEDISYVKATPGRVGLATQVRRV